MGDAAETNLPYLWSDHAHVSWGKSRLVFWRLAFVPSYERDDIFRRLAELFLLRQLDSYAVYEVFGAWDLLLRLWLPDSVKVEEFDTAIHRGLASHSLDASEYMEVTVTPRHWLWRPGPEEPQVPSGAPPSPSAIDAVNHHNRVYCRRLDDFVDLASSDDSAPAFQSTAEANATELTRLTRDGWLRQFNPEQHGILFFIQYGAPKRALRPSEREVALRRIVATCDNVRKAAADYPDHDVDPHVTVYAGAGTMTNFLIVAKAPDRHFYRFARSLVFRLNRETDMDQLYGSRPFTYVIAHRRFMAFQDTLPLKQARYEEFDLGLLDEDESESLEFKATLSADINRYVATGEWAAFEKGPDEVVKAVCGLLNAPSGGDLVIGVQEVARILDRIPKGQERLAEFPTNTRGDKVLVGIEPDMQVIKSVSDWDTYRLRLAQLIAQKIIPLASPYISIDRRDVKGRILTVIRLRPSTDTWFYARIGDTLRFYARELGRTREYQGPDVHAYMRAHPRAHWEG